MAFSQDSPAPVNMDNIETQPIEESQAWVKLHAPLPFLYLQCQDPQEEVNMITVGPMAYRDDDAFSDCSTGRRTLRLLFIFFGAGVSLT